MTGSKTPCRYALVTGATGFVGRHLVKALRERGVRVRCLVRATSNRAGLEGAGVDFVVGDVVDAASVAEAVKDVDVVFHSAAMLRAPWREAFVEVNVGGCRIVAEACAQRTRGEDVPRLVVVSSLAASGPSTSGRPRTEDDAPAPISAYGRSKLAGEQEARGFAGVVPTSIVRPPGVFGPGDPMMPKLFEMVRRGVQVVPGSKVQRMSLIHVTDLVNFLIAVAESGERVPARLEGGDTGVGVYLIAHDRVVSQVDLGAFAAQLLGRPEPRRIHLPDPLLFVGTTIGEGIARLRDVPTIFNRDKYLEATGGDWTADNAKARALDGFDLECGLLERLEQTLSA